MARFHMNKETGSVGVCRAVQSCPFGGDENHSDSIKGARNLYEEHMEASLIPSNSNVQENTQKSNTQKSNKDQVLTFEEVGELPKELPENFNRREIIGSYLNRDHEDKIIIFGDGYKVSGRARSIYVDDSKVWSIPVVKDGVSSTLHLPLRRKFNVIERKSDRKIKEEKEALERREELRIAELEADRFEELKKLPEDSLKDLNEDDARILKEGLEEDAQFAEQERIDNANRKWEDRPYRLSTADLSIKEIDLTRAPIDFIRDNTDFSSDTYNDKAKKILLDEIPREEKEEKIRNLRTYYIEGLSHEIDRQEKTIGALRADRGSVLKNALSNFLPPKEIDLSFQESKADEIATERKRLSEFAKQLFNAPWRAPIRRR